MQHVMKSGYLKAQVPQPLGFADLRQAILAENYQNTRIRLSADIKTDGVEQQAGLYLRVIDPAMTKPPEERQQVTFQGTHDWTRNEIQVEVPPREHAYPVRDQPDRKRTDLGDECPTGEHPIDIGTVM